MSLDEIQKKKIASWIDAGLKLSEIQTRLASEMGIQMTYMDVRLLVDDLKLVPKDPASPAMHPLAAQGPQSQKNNEVRSPKTPGGTGVSIASDQIARPGTIVSGKVTFSDGNKAEWYLDQTGRLGLVPQQTGYRPTEGDLQQFQSLLETELVRLGL